MKAIRRKSVLNLHKECMGTVEMYVVYMYGSYMYC